jgi:hypothetical protein
VQHKHGLAHGIPAKLVIDFVEVRDFEVTRLVGLKRRPQSARPVFGLAFFAIRGCKSQANKNED